MDYNFDQDIFSLTNDYDMSCIDNETATDCQMSLESQIRKLNDAIGDQDTDPVCYQFKTDAITCENSSLHKVLLGYCFPIVLTVCLLGNVANILTYRGKCLRKSTTVKMLTAKAIMNMVFMLCLIPHFFLVTFGGMANTLSLEYYLWNSYPYMLFLANIAGTCATWLTVFMTLETYVIVSWPMHSKTWCTTKNFIRILSCIIIVASCLHIQIPLTRFVRSIPCDSTNNKFVHKIYARNGTLYSTWESVHLWGNLVIALALPNVILVVLTGRLTHKLMYCSLPNYSESKLCVTRITLATTACQLTLEAPSVLVYAIAALYGPTFINDDPVMCACHVLTNFANQLNASICFLIYLLCSSKFRQLLLRPNCCTVPRKRRRSYETLRRTNVSQQMQTRTSMHYSINDIPLLHINPM